MKINKLYTLSQFVDLQNLIMADETYITKPSDINSENIDNWNTATIHAFGRIQKYNDFLKQPLKKEMFGNELEIPLEMYYRPDEGCQKYPQECYLSDLEIFKTAEKKVIFKDSSTLHEGGIACFKTEDDTFNIEISEWTLHELAEKTNGELELQNVKL